MKKRTFYTACGAALFVFLIILTLASPLFEVRQVVVAGNATISEQDVLALAGLQDPGNIFAVSASGAKKGLLSNPYVDTAVIRKDYAGRTVTVTITERQLSGYVEYLSGTYLYIDEYGRVLSVATSFSEKLPVVVGLKFDAFEVGEVLQVQNQSSFDTMVLLAHLFKKYDMAEHVVRVSLHDPGNTRLYINNLDVELGDVRDADEKIRTVKAILEKMEDPDAKGFLDVKDMSKPARFRALT